MKTYFTTYFTRWHQLLWSILPPRPEPSRARRYRSRIRRPCPVSSACYRRPTDIPVLPETYATGQPVDSSVAHDTRALLSTLIHHDHVALLSLTSDDVPVVLDSGATIAIGIDKSDFIGAVSPCPMAELKGIGSGLAVKGIGTVKWTFRDTDGALCDVRLRALYVPDCPVRLLPPQQLSTDPNGNDSNGAWIGCGEHALVFYNGHCLPFCYDQASNLPIGKTVPGVSRFQAFLGRLSVSDPPSAGITDTNMEPLFGSTLSDDQRLLLDFHRRYGHVGMSRIQDWARAGLFGIPKRVSRCSIPVCPGCHFGGMHRRPHSHEIKSNSVPIEAPGDFVAADQMESALGGRIPFTRGRPSNRRYKCSTVFVDAFSKYAKSCLQESTAAEPTVASKHAFEADCRRHDVHVRHYRADNGAFATQKFRAAVASAGQSMSFSGVGAHFQNGLAERYIGVFTRTARILLLEAMSRFPGVIDESFWSFAFQHAVLLHNHTPRSRSSGPGFETPFESFAMTDSPYDVSCLHPFGCPVFVLDPALADGQPIRKWRERCYQGIYVGHSPEHASNVPLIYNPRTELVSPAYHVVFDDDFHSATMLAKNENPAAIIDAIQRLIVAPENQWKHKDQFSVYPDELIDRRYLDHAASATRELLLEQHRHAAAALASAKRHLDAAFAPPSKRSRTDVGSFTPVLAPEGVSDGAVPSPPLGPDQILALIRSLGYSLPPGVAFVATSTAPLQSSVPSSFSTGTSAVIPPHDPAALRPDDWPGIAQAALDCMPIDHTLNLDSLHACIVSSNPDILTQGEMFRATDCADFLRSQVDEITTLETENVWRVIPRTELPPTARPLHAVWSYRRKRRPDGSLLKYKSRICADGSMQEQHRDFTETYAPVVQWSTVRLVLVYASLLGLVNCQVDFAQAFTQADIDTDVFLAVPQGWFYDPSADRLIQHSDPRHRDREHCLHLVKNLYGTRQGARNWFLFLRDVLLSPKFGFKQSRVDPCLFIREDCLLTLYTDDCCMFGASQRVLDDLKSALSEQFVLRDEGCVEDFLGVRIRPAPEHGPFAFEMTQTGLIDQILADVGLSAENDESGARSVSMSNKKFVPATDHLRTNSDAAPFDAPWSYRSVIGKLNFLAANTRPDISYAVHSAARFCNQPNKDCQLYIKYLCRYLLGTRSKGLLFLPNMQHQLTAHADADFCGLFSAKTSHLREAALSRSGFIVAYAGCPILWKSALQTIVALSTCEAEYVALSDCVRSLLPLRRILDELQAFQSHPGCGSAGMTIENKQLASIIFEDNVGALEIASKEAQYRPRTKHIAIRYHHFRDHVADGSLIIKKIDTKEQIADIFTKPLPRVTFEHLRQKLCGW